MMTGMVEREAQVWSKSFVSPRRVVCPLLGGHYGAPTCANCQHGTLNLANWVRDTNRLARGLLVGPVDSHPPKRTSDISEIILNNSSSTFLVKEENENGESQQV